MLEKRRFVQTPDSFRRNGRVSGVISPKGGFTANPITEAPIWPDEFLISIPFL